MNNTVELFLDGKVFMIEKDENGNEVSREELDGQLVLKLIQSFLEDAIKAYTALEKGDTEINP